MHLHARARLALLLSWSLLAAGCGAVRPTRPPQALQCRLAEFEVRDIYHSQYKVQRAPVHVLALSAGGEFGAYGAGFLVGWGAVGPTALPGPRSDIHTVTGVSTGAIMATHAFLGEDQVLEEFYTSASGPQIYEARAPLEYLWANSLYTTAGKERIIARYLDEATVRRVVAVAGDTGRELYVGVVDLDSGAFVRIDMVKLARTLLDEDPRRAVDCYRAVVSASSAIPIAFPPRFVDGRMLVDGGARWHVFLAAAQPGEARGRHPGRVYAFVHGSLDVGRHPPRNGVLQIAERTSSVLTDQSLETSVRWLDVLAHGGPDGKLPRYEIVYAAAARAACACAPERQACDAAGGPSGPDLFCNPFMRCLARHGEADGRDAASGARPWLDLEGVFAAPEGCAMERRLGQ